MRNLFFLLFSIVAITFYSCTKSADGPITCHIKVYTDSLYDGSLKVNTYTFNYDYRNYVTLISQTGADNVDWKYTYLNNTITKKLTYTTGAKTDKELDTIILQNGLVTEIRGHELYASFDYRNFYEYDVNLIKFEYSNTDTDTLRYAWQNGDLIKTTLTNNIPSVYINTFTGMATQLGDKYSVRDLFDFGGAASLWKNAHLPAIVGEMYPLYNATCNYTFDSKGKITRILYTDTLSNWDVKSYKYDCQ